MENFNYPTWYGCDTSTQAKLRCVRAAPDVRQNFSVIRWNLFMLNSATSPDRGVDHQRDVRMWMTTCPHFSTAIQLAHVRPTLINSAFTTSNCSVIHALSDSEPLTYILSLQNKVALFIQCALPLVLQLLPASTKRLEHREIASAEKKKKKHFAKPVSLRDSIFKPSHKSSISISPDPHLPSDEATSSKLHDAHHAFSG